LQQNGDENGMLEDDLVLGEEGLTWEDVGNATEANTPTRVTRHHSRLATLVSNGDEELEVEEEEFEIESSNEQDNINVVELRSEYEAYVI
jgi:hypothetical protein